KGPHRRVEVGDQPLELAIALDEGPEGLPGRIDQVREIVGLGALERLGDLSARSSRRRAVGEGVVEGLGSGLALDLWILGLVLSGGRLLVERLPVLDQDLA